MEHTEKLAQEDNKHFKTDPIFACKGKSLLDFLGLLRAFTEMIGGESHHTRNQPQATFQDLVLFGKVLSTVEGAM